MQRRRGIRETPGMKVKKEFLRVCVPTLKILIKLARALPPPAGILCPSSMPITHYGSGS